MSTTPLRPRERRPSGRPTREETARIDVAVRDAALETFLEHGYAGTSMDAIAAAAGVTKAAVYSRYPSKSAVFAAVLKWATESEQWPVPQRAVPRSAGLEGTLRALARAALRHDLHPDLIKLYRIVAAQADRFPDLAERISVRPAWPTRDRVVAALHEHAPGAGVEVPDDPVSWAQLFLGLVCAVPVRRAVVGASYSQRDLERHIDASLKIFLSSLRSRTPEASPLEGGTGGGRGGAAGSPHEDAPVDVGRETGPGRRRPVPSGTRARG